MCNFTRCNSPRIPKKVRGSFAASTCPRQGSAISRRRIKVLRTFIASGGGHNPLPHFPRFRLHPVSSSPPDCDYNLNSVIGFRVNIIPLVEVSVWILPIRFRLNITPHFFIPPQFRSQPHSSSDCDHCLDFVSTLPGGIIPPVSILLMDRNCSPAPI